MIIEGLIYVFKIEQNDNDMFYIYLDKNRTGNLLIYSFEELTRDNKRANNNFIIKSKLTVRLNDYIKQRYRTYKNGNYHITIQVNNNTCMVTQLTKINSYGFNIIKHQKMEIKKMTVNYKPIINY